MLLVRPIKLINKQKGREKGKKKKFGAGNSKKKFCRPLQNNYSCKIFFSLPGPSKSLHTKSLLAGDRQDSFTGHTSRFTFHLIKTLLGYSDRDVI